MELEGRLYQSSSEDALAFHLGSFSTGSNRAVLDRVQQPYFSAMVAVKLRVDGCLTRYSCSEIAPDQFYNAFTGATYCIFRILLLTFTIFFRFFFVFNKVRSISGERRHHSVRDLTYRLYILIYLGLSTENSLERH